MPVQWYEGQIERIDQLSTNTKSFVLKITEMESFDFLPGQFMTFDLPIGDKRLNRWRSYSLASRPDGGNLIEFCIVKNEKGLGTSYLFELNVGDKIKCKGPEGGFVVPENIENIEVIMICTGTGVAPFRSMIRHVIDNNLTFKKIHLIFGTRNVQNILYRAEFEKLASNYYNFQYDIALSKDKIDGIHHGYVHDIYLKSYRDATNNRIFMVCGWTSMVDDTIANLLIKCHYDKSQIKYELYG
jgi:ferredoxin-NADP reductase